MNKRIKYCIVLFVVTVINLRAIVVPPLEREITLNLVNEPVPSALIRIQEQTGLIFSYQSSIIKNIAPVSLQIKRKTVREALTLLLPGNIIYKPKDNYIILKEKPQDKNSKKAVISGYVYDQNTDQKLANVTIYDKETLISATTDEYGFYTMSVPAENKNLTITKENYADTTIKVLDTASRIINIRIQPKPRFLALADSIHWQEKISMVNKYSRKLFQQFKGYIHTINIKDTITRDFQVSVLPFIGTNHRLSGNVVNKTSLNIYGGYARGLNGFEAGGLFNLEKENVKGFQMAGLFNVVGDSVKGSQLAGLINITGKSSEGFQASGLMNINEGSHKGFQAAGLMNINGISKGTSVAGLMNIASHVKRAQLAGLANIQDTLEGFSAAGMFNVCDHAKRSVQASGLFNIADGGKSDLQIAGLFNSAAFLSGVQIAPLNFADSATGVPLGLLSFVKKGVHQIEISADEVFKANVSLRTGVNAFYNILTFGFEPGGSQPLWHVGYGAGTSFLVKGKLRSDICFTVQHLNKNGFHFGASDLYRLYWGVEYKFGKKFSVAAGPTFNLFVTDALLPDYSSIYQHVGPRPLSDHTSSDDFNTKSWIGGRIALRFL